MKTNFFRGVCPLCGAVALKTASAYGFLSAPLLTTHLEQFPAHLQHSVNKQGKALGQKPRTRQAPEIPHWASG